MAKRMKYLRGVKIRCVPCGKTEGIRKGGGKFFDPPGWTKRGMDTVCDECSAKLEVKLHPEVRLAAEKVVHSIQSLIATELSNQPPPGSSLVRGSDGASRRMKRCELLSRYADAVMTVYGNEVGFRLAQTGAFGYTTLTNIVSACEDLMKAEIAFSEARAQKPYKKTSNLGNYTINARDYNGVTDYDDYEPRIAGPLFRFNEIAKIAQKLAQLASTRAGEYGVSPEDKVLDDAVDHIQGGYGGGIGIGANNDHLALQRQIMMIAQKFIETEQAKSDRREAEKLAVDPVVELEDLLKSRAMFESSNRHDAVRAVDARILLVEAKLRSDTESMTVDSALAAEASSKDVTPKDVTPKDVTPKDSHTTHPPDESEIKFLRRTIGDEAVKSGWPEEFARSLTSEVAKRFTPQNGVDENHIEMKMETE